jgi:hypothetical protein
LSSVQLVAPRSSVKQLIALSSSSMEHPMRLYEKQDRAEAAAIYGAMANKEPFAVLRRGEKFASIPERKCAPGDVVISRVKPSA